ncbi:MAG: MFS transporter [Gammaproteobacteria bacterium]
MERKNASTVVLVALAISALPLAFSSAMIYTALATLQREFADPAAVGWLITGFLLVSTAFAALGGRLGDLYGRSRMLLATLLLTGIGGLVSAVADDVRWVIAGRCLQGCSAAILPLCIGLVRENLERQRVPFGIGMVVTANSVFAGLGAVLAGAIVQYASWPWVFFATAFAAGLGLVAVWRFVPRSLPIPGVRMDLGSGLLFVPAIAGLVFPLTHLNDWGWRDPRTLAWVVPSAALLAFWFRDQWRREHPLIDVRMLADRQVALTNLLGACIGMSIYQLALFMMLLLQQPLWTGVGMGIGAALAGLLKLPSNAMSMIGGPLSGWLAGRFGARIAAVIGAACGALGGLAMLLWHDSVVQIIGASLVIGMSIAITNTALPALLFEVVPADRTSESNGVLVVIRGAFQAVGAQVVTALLAASHVLDAAGVPTIHPDRAAYLRTFAWVAAAMTVGTAVALALPRRPGAR